MDVPHSPDGVEAYPHGHQPSVLASHAARTADNSCAYFLDRLEPGPRILDPGCGPGSITLHLAERVGPQGHVVGVDFSADAIDAARTAAGTRGVTGVEFVVGDLFDLDVEPGSFDVVHAHQVLQHLADPVKALRAMAGYCTQGGLIAVRDADYGAMAWYPQLPGVTEWFTTYCRSARATGGEPDAGRRLRAWANAAGLDITYAGSSTWTYAAPEATAWWGNTQADRVVHSTFSERARAQGLTAGDLQAMAHDWRAWGQDPDAWFFLPHGELIAVNS